MRILCQAKSSQAKLCCYIKLISNRFNFKVNYTRFVYLCVSFWVFLAFAVTLASFSHLNFSHTSKLRTQKETKKLHDKKMKWNPFLSTFATHEINLILGLPCLALPYSASSHLTLATFIRIWWISRSDRIGEVWRKLNRNIEPILRRIRLVWHNIPGRFYHKRFYC